MRLPYLRFSAAKLLQIHAINLYFLALQPKVLLIVLYVCVFLFIFAA